MRPLNTVGLPKMIYSSLKPHQVHDSRTIREMSCETTLPAFTDRFETKDFTFQLDIRHIAIYLVNVIDAAPVDVFVGEIVNQIMQGVDS